VTWRTGRKLGRTVYHQNNAEVPDYLDVFVGIMDTRALADLVCLALNILEEHDPHTVACVLDDALAGGQDSALGAPSGCGDLPTQRSVDPDDTCGSIMTVDNKDRIYVVPEDDRAVPPVPPDADPPVVELNPGRDDTGTRDP
jgi:hypothetical protein